MLNYSEPIQQYNSSLQSDEANQLPRKPLPMSYMESLLQNLIELLKREQEQLTSGNVSQLQETAKKKMQALVQLNTLTEKGNVHNLARTYERELRQLDELLKDNVKKLNFRMKAIVEITDTIESAVSHAESDGTYEAGTYKIKPIS